MPQKLNKAGKMQDYIPKGNGDASGEYGTSNGTNKNFTTSDKKKTEANVIIENKSVVVENKGKTKEKDFWEEKIDKLEKTIDGLTKADAKGNKKPIEDLEKELQDARFSKDLVDAYKELEELEKSNKDGSLDSMIEEKKNEMKSIEDNYKEWKKTGLNVAQQENRDKENARKTQANIIDDDLSGKKENKNNYDGKIHLQGIGNVDAKKAENLKVGDITMWNFGYTETIEKIEPTKSGNMLVITIKSSDSGKTYERRMKKDRLVGITDKENRV